MNGFLLASSTSSRLSFIWYNASVGDVFSSSSLLRSVRFNCFFVVVVVIATFGYIYIVYTFVSLEEIDIEKET